MGNTSKKISNHCIKNTVINKQCLKCHKKKNKYCKNCLECNNCGRQSICIFSHDISNSTVEINKRQCRKCNSNCDCRHDSINHMAYSCDNCNICNKCDMCMKCIIGLNKFKLCDNPYTISKLSYESNINLEYNID
jgi:hypothetical protein